MENKSTDLYKFFPDFLNSRDTLRIYHEGKLAFTSEKDRVVPILEYIDDLAPGTGPSVIFDRIMGNAAALLCVKAGTKEVFSPLGSQLGIDTLKKYRIEYHLNKIVPFIQKDNSEEMCFMEKLSINKTPDEFYRDIKQIIN